MCFQVHVSWEDIFLHLLRILFSTFCGIFISHISGVIEEGGKGIDKDLVGMARHETQSDKVFCDFQKRIAHDPEQSLRYQRGGKYF